MRINPSIPIHIARAYQLAPKAKLQPPTPAEQTPIGNVNQTSNVDVAKKVQELIAGTVKGPVTFSPATTPTNPGGPLQLYNRAADTIEAATGIELGRTIDVRG